MRLLIGFDGRDGGRDALRLARLLGGREEARLAAQRARALAEAHGAAVRVLTVVAPPVALPGVAGYAPVDR